MKRAFLILGFRSRSAWLSQFFSVGEAYCYHDLNYLAGGPEQAAKVMVETPQQIVGMACSGNAQHLEILTRKLNNPPLLVIRRDPADVVRSLERVTGLPAADWRDLMIAYEARLDAAQASHRAMVVRYEDLDDPHWIKHAWFHCTGGQLAFPTQHWEKMRTMHVEIHPSRMWNVAHGLPPEGRREEAA